MHNILKFNLAVADIIGMLAFTDPGTDVLTCLHTGYRLQQQKSELVSLRAAGI